MNFEFATASRIIFGNGKMSVVAPMAAEMGRSALIITGRRSERAAPLVASMHKAGLQTMSFRIPREPTISMISEGVVLASQKGCDIIIGLGGGSVIDAAKAIAVLLSNTGEIMQYLEVIGEGKLLTEPSIQCIVLPTTAGTGAEVTSNSVLTSPENNVKVSLRHPTMLPDLVVIDPELTHSMPPALTAATGLDALTQLLESFVSLRSNPLTDALCCDGMKRVARSLPRAYQLGSDGTAREDMALASLFSGLALANAKLGAVHGFAGPIGGMFDAPHGVICARLLPFVMEANIRALKDKGDRQFLTRYDHVAQILTGKIEARAEDGLQWVQDFCTNLDIPRLSTFGIVEEHFSEIVVRAKKASSIKGNPVSLTDQELRTILHKAIKTA